MAHGRHIITLRLSSTLNTHKSLILKFCQGRASDNALGRKVVNIIIIIIKSTLNLSSEI